MLKPSEFASPSVVELVLMLGDILPPGVVNVVTGFGLEACAALVADPRIAKISFTGGGVAARRIMAAAAQELTPSTTELGGNMVVCADAVSRAASAQTTRVLLPPSSISDGVSSLARRRP